MSLIKSPRVYQNKPRQHQNSVQIMTSSALIGSSKVRVRFAPSPTGHVHLGGLRTALYNYIFAKQNNGKFILRIEDTDQTRVQPGSAEEIEDVLNWSGLKPDEGPTIGGDYGPYQQSRRLTLYKDRCQELLEAGKAYRCFCSPDRLDLLRKYQARNREKLHYDGKCKQLSPSEIKEKICESHGRYAIRFALSPGRITFEDIVFGSISGDLVESVESDPIILKSDSFPTYHFANVVDDHSMKISHVLRGSEWISSTVKHIQIYKALGWQAPTFAHFPLITLRDGKKLSKRNDSSHVKSWIESGYWPTAILNFLTNMGGGVPKAKQDSNELWPLDRLVEEFNFKDVVCHPGSVDIDRLNIYNSHDIKVTWQLDSDKIVSKFRELLRRNNIESKLSDHSMKKLLSKPILRINTLNDLLSPEYAYIWKYPTLDWSASDYIQESWNLQAICRDIMKLVETIDIEDKEFLTLRLKELASQHNVPYSKFMKLIRKLLTSRETGLPIYDIFQCLGKERAHEYLSRAMHHLEKT